jgi:catechol 2,3-dioxygenase-like lactoylglutathione lyase family enzyme
MMWVDVWRETMDVTDRLAATGAQAIADGYHVSPSLPWDFQGTVFRCTWEYPVRDFEVEVGFYLDVLGFTTIALDNEYALFTTPDNDLTFACRRHVGESRNYSGHILCFMTRNIEAFATALEARVGPDAITRVAGSPVQTVLRLSSPAGVQIDIWEFPS